MNSKVLIVMRKSFVAGFYSAHSGLLLAGFAMLVSYFFLINTLGTVQADVITYWQFFFAIKIASDPVFLAGFCLMYLLYVLKANHYVYAQLQLPKYSFLAQSLTCLPQSAQLMVWVSVYLQISLPLVVFTGYFLIVGSLFGHFMLPLMLMLFGAGLTLWSSIITHRNLSHPMETNVHVILRLIFEREKPISALYLFEVIHRSKISLLLSKILSCLLLFAVPKLVDLQEQDNRIFLFTGSMVVMAHAALVYQERNFNQRYLGFLLNLPIRFMKRFFYPLLAYVVFLLPELLSIIFAFPLASAVGVVLFVFSMLSLFRSLASIPNLRVKGFLVAIFSVFFVFYLLMMFGLGWYAIPFSLLASLALFAKNYLEHGLVD